VESGKSSSNPVNSGPVVGLPRCPHDLLECVCVGGGVECVSLTAQFKVVRQSAACHEYRIAVWDGFGNLLEIFGREILWDAFLA